MRASHSTIRQLASLFTLLALSASMAGGPAQARPTTAGMGDRSNRWILFERFVQRTPEGPFLKDLFLVREDGSGERPLLAEPIDEAANVLHADWSPDGTHIAFEVLGADGADTAHASVWVVPVNGRDPQLVASCDADPCRQYSYPDWSPDGRRLAVIRYDLYNDGSCCTSHLTVLDIPRPNSGSIRPLNERVVQAFTETDVDSTYDVYLDPSWSSDGKRLVYEVAQYDIAEPYPLVTARLAVVGVGRSAPPATFITPPQLPAGNPDWSPNGERIAFATHPLGAYQSTTQPSNIYTIRPDGTGLRQVTTASVDGSYRVAVPNWSPDGRRLVVTVARASDGENVDSVELGVVQKRTGIVSELGVFGAGGKLQPPATRGR